jgi:aerobic-type carbon monoxide dehydrogenase small subunit (CoxS/CutS family)
MSEEKNNEQMKGLSRREFLKDAGLVVGGATVGSMAFLSGCKTTTTETTTKTVAGSTVTVTAAPVTKYIDPIDGTEWPTLDALKAHFAAVRPLASLAGNFININVNGVNYYLQVGDMEILAFTLREKLGLFGTKIGCDHGQCGVCTVLVDGVPLYSCLLLSIEMSGRKIQTVEGLSDGLTLNPLQQKFYDADAVQCGYCTPGVLMAATALLAAKPKPTSSDVRLALSGHLCFCQNMTYHVNSITGGV